MNKCTNCGTEFDGKFCPECGQKWVDKNSCPQCGSKLAADVKFCPECGHRVGLSEDNKPDTNVRKRKSADDIEFAKWLNGILRYVPMALALLFAVLLPLLYIAPIAEASELMGAAEKVNVYSLDEDFYGVSVAFLVFMCIAVVLAIVTLYLHINKDRRNTYITLFGRVRIAVGELAALLAVVLVYLPCIIISAVAMGNAAELNELLGGGLMDVVSAGAALKAILSFAVIFTVLAIGCAIANILIAKSNPELLPKDYEDERVEVTPRRKPLLYYAFLNAKLRHAVFAFFMCLVFTLIMMSFFTGVLSDAATFKPYIIVTIGAGITAVAVVVCMLLPNDRNWSPDKFIFEVCHKRKHNRYGLDARHDRCKLGIKKSIFLFAIVASWIVVFIINAVRGRSVYMRSIIMVAAYFGISAIIYVIAKVAIAKQSGLIAKYLFGMASPLPDMPLAVEFNQERELQLYDEYMFAKKRRAVIGGSGSAKQNVFMRRLSLTISCILFVATTIACAVVSPFLTNKFSASFVSDAAKAMQSEQYVNIETLFGKPNEFEEYDENSLLAVYYDDKYADLKTKLEKAQKESDIAKIQELNSKIAALTFNSLTIMIEKRSQDYNDHLDFAIVEGMVLNTKTTGGKTTSQKKTTKSVNVFYIKYNRYDRHSGYYVEIFYKDGSYKFTPLPADALSQIDPDKSGVQTVKWSDEWGTYSATVKSV